MKQIVITYDEKHIPAEVLELLRKREESVQNAVSGLIPLHWRALRWDQNRSLYRVIRRGDKEITLAWFTPQELSVLPDDKFTERIRDTEMTYHQEEAHGGYHVRKPCKHQMFGKTTFRKDLVTGTYNPVPVQSIYCGLKAETFAEAKAGMKTACLFQSNQRECPHFSAGAPRCE